MGVIRWVTMWMMTNEQRESFTILMSVGLALFLCGISIHYLLYFLEWWSALLSGLGLTVILSVTFLFIAGWLFSKKKR